MSGPLPRKSAKRYRIVGDLYILFWDKDTIYADDGKRCYAYHRWFQREKFFYTRNWRPFMRYATENNSLTIEGLNKVAKQHDIYIKASKLPMPRIKIYELPSQHLSYRRRQYEKNRDLH